MVTKSSPTPARVVVLKVWAPDQQHWHHVGTCRDAKSPRPADGPSGLRLLRFSCTVHSVNHGPESGSTTMALFLFPPIFILSLQSLHHHNRHPLCLCCFLADNVSFRAETSRVMGVKSLWKSLLLFKHDGAL